MNAEAVHLVAQPLIYAINKKKCKQSKGYGFLTTLRMHDDWIALLIPVI